MKEQESSHSVGMMAKMFSISRSGYYAWKARPESRRYREDTELEGRIRAIQTGVKNRYGSPRMTRELRRDGFTVGHNRVARLMRNAGLSAKPKRKYRVTTQSGHSHPPAENLLGRNFAVTESNRVWVSDITYGAPR